MEKECFAVEIIELLSFNETDTMMRPNWRYVKVICSHPGHNFSNRIIRSCKQERRSRKVLNSDCISG